MKICGFTKFKSGLLGEKLGHSFSPQIHDCLADYSYTLFEKSPEEAEAFLRSGDFDGINVTIPYKKLAFSLCDEVSEVASKIGSVNTVVKNGNKIKGYNTDYYGFTYLVKKAGFDVSKAIRMDKADKAVEQTAAPAKNSRRRVAIEEDSAPAPETKQRRTYTKLEEN